MKRATAAEKIQAAKALEEAYSAEQAAEQARATLEKATLEADVIVKAEIEKQQLELKAEAELNRPAAAQRVKLTLRCCVCRRRPTVCAQS